MVIQIREDILRIKDIFGQKQFGPRRAIVENGLIKNKFDFWFWVPSWLRLCSFSYQKTNKATIQYFYDRFGKNRIKRISQLFNLCIEKENYHLTASAVRKLMIGLGYVQKDDLKEMLTPGEHLGKVSSERVKQIYETLLPITNPAELCVSDKTIRLVKKRELLAKQLNIEEKVALMMLMRNDSKIKQMEWENIKAIHLIVPTTPVGLVIPQTKGYCYIKEKISFHGGRAFILRAIGKENHKKTIDHQIHFTGTVLNPFAEGSFATIGNDFIPEGVGLGGFASLQKNTRFQSYLGKFSNARISGYSLGGAIAQKVFLNYFSHFSKLMTFHSPSISDSFRDFNLDGEGKKVVHVIHERDFVHLAGHFRVRLNKGKNRIYVKEIKQQAKPKIPHPGICRNARSLVWNIGSYVKAHFSAGSLNVKLNDNDTSHKYWKMVFRERDDVTFIEQIRQKLSFIARFTLSLPQAVASEIYSTMRGTLQMQTT